MAHDLIDSYEEYAQIYNRPASLTVTDAIRKYMGIFDRIGIKHATARYYYHTRTPYFRNWLNGVGLGKAPAAKPPSAPVVQLTEVLPDEPKRPSLNVGAILMASLEDRKEIVQVKLIDGDQVCVKTLDGFMRVYNASNLREISF